MNNDSIELFQGCWHHIDRAESHRLEMAQVWEEFLEREPFETTLSSGDDEGWYELWVEQTSPSPHLLPILFGEWLYHLRAALDGVIYAVAVHDSRRNPPDDARTLTFPVCTTESGFKHQLKGLTSLADKHLALVRFYQPFNAENPKEQMLYWVNHLARLDRHRLLHVVGGGILKSEPLVHASGRKTITFDLGIPSVQSLHSAAMLARFKVEPNEPEKPVEANPNTWIDLEILEFLGSRLDYEWLRAPLGERMRHMEFELIAVIVGLFERSCLGRTRPGVEEMLVDESDIDIPGFPCAKHE